MGYVVLVPLAGVIFYSLGRHPLALLALLFAVTYDLVQRNRSQSTRTPTRPAPMGR